MSETCAIQQRCFRTSCSSRLEIDASRYTGILKYTTVGDRIETAWFMRDREIERDSPSLAKSLRNAVIVRCGSVDGAWVVPQDGRHRLTLVPSLISWSRVIHFSHEPNDVFVETVERSRGVNVLRRDDDDRADPWEAWQ